VARSCPPAVVEVGQKGSVQIVPRFSSFKLVVSSLARRGGAISGIKYLVPQPFATRGN
jgi:hypothetical protein